MYRFFLIIITFCFFFSSEAADVSYSKVICSSNECYTIVDELGSGAFGKVYSVIDSDGNYFAIKSYKLNQIETSDIAWRLLGDVEREYQLGQLFDHPNIIHTIELFQESQQQEYYILMDLVKGKTIRQIPKKSYTEQQSHDLALQLVDTLKYSLQLGYLYLDLHTNNIMVSDTNDIKVIDLASFFSWEELLMFENTQDEKNAKALNIPPLRKKKIEKFLEKNPKLQKKLKPQNYVKKDFHQIKEYWNSTYFNQITDLCIELIRKSNLSIEEKIERRVKLKTLAWEYQEKVEERINEHTINEYLDELTTYLVS